MQRDNAAEPSSRLELLGRRLVEVLLRPERDDPNRLLALLPGRCPTNQPSASANQLNACVVTVMGAPLVLVASPPAKTLPGRSRHAASTHSSGTRLPASCPGRKPPFLAVKHPPRPYKRAIQHRFTMENAKAA